MFLLQNLQNFFNADDDVYPRPSGHLAREDNASQCYKHYRSRSFVSSSWSQVRRRREHGRRIAGAARLVLRARPPVLRIAAVQVSSVDDEGAGEGVYRVMVRGFFGTRM